MKQIRFILPLVAIVAGMAACKKDDDKTAAPKVTTGVYVLNEGRLNNNNTTLTYYNFNTGTASTDFYASVNGNSLGETGNDLLLHGGKMYLVMNGSSYVQVMDVMTAKSLKNITFKNGAGVDRLPRFAVAYKNKVLVSAFDGTVAVIDTTTLEIEKNITVGANPEQMAVSGDKLYVANSGGYNPPLFDSTISVVSLTSFTELQKIKVGVNPYNVVADSAGNIYVSCTGDYGGIVPKMVKVNTVTNTVVKSADTTVGRLRYFDGQLYATGGYMAPTVRALSTIDFSQKSANFITDGTKVTMPYGLNIDVNSGDVYVTDAKDYKTSGEVFCFDKTGKKKFSFKVTPGLNPNTVVFIKQ